MGSFVSSEVIIYGKSSELILLWLKAVAWNSFILVTIINYFRFVVKKSACPPLFHHQSKSNAN